jgi:hypothetical protein
MGPLRVTIPCVVVGGLAAACPVAANAQAYCADEYAEDLSALSQHARYVEGANAPYSYAVRTAATYECVSYGSDGNLKKSRSETAKTPGPALGIADIESGPPVATALASTPG